MRSLDQIYWDSLCDNYCNCQNLVQALLKHPRLAEMRDQSLNLNEQLKALGCPFQTLRKSISKRIEKIYAL